MKLLRQIMLSFLVLLVMFILNCGQEQEVSTPTEIDLLIEKLDVDTEDHEGYRQAVIALGEQGHKAKDAIPALLDGVSHHTWEFCPDIITTIPLIAPEPADIIPELIEIAEEEASEYYCRAPAQIIASFGPSAKIAYPQLMEGLRAGKWESCWSVPKLITLIAPDPDETIGELIEILGNEDSPGRIAAAKTLGHFGPASKDALPVLIDALSNSEADVSLSIAAALAISFISANEPEDIIPDLVKALQNKEWYARRSAALTLSFFGPSIEDAIPALINLLEDEKLEMRTQAARTLGKAGAAAKVAVPVLIDGLRDEDAGSSFALGLGWIGPDAKAAVPILVDILENSPDDGKQANMALVIGLIGADASASVPALTRALKSQNRNVRSNAARALGKFGADAAKSLPILIERLQSMSIDDIVPPSRFCLSDAYETVCFAYAIVEIGGDSDLVLPFFIKFLDDEWHVMTRQLATNGLGRIGRAASAALPKLWQIANKELPPDLRSVRPMGLDEYTLRDAAREAIAKIEGTWSVEEVK